MAEWNVTFRPFQEKFMQDNSRFPAFVAAWGTGKRLDINTEVKTANGWKLLRDIEDGDMVYGFNGK